MSGGQYHRLLRKLDAARANARRARAGGRLRRWRYWQRRAEHVFRCDVCRAPGAVECRLPDTELYQPPDELLCAEHCYRAGYCHGCVGFFAGIECFDFCNPSQLCEECDHQMRADFGEYNEQDTAECWYPEDTLP